MSFFTKCWVALGVAVVAAFGVRAQEADDDAEPDRAPAADMRDASFGAVLEAVQPDSPSRPSAADLTNWQKAGVIGVDCSAAALKPFTINLPPSSPYDLREADEAGQYMQDCYKDVKEYGPDVLDAVKQRWNRSPQSDDADVAGSAEESDAEPPVANAVEPPSDEPAAVSEDSVDNESSLPGAEYNDPLGDTGDHTPE